MSLSSDEDLIASINNATVQLNRYFPIIIYIFGIVGNVLNLIVLSRRTLRSNPCTLLFLISSLSSLIAIISGLTTRLTAGWADDLSETIGWLCKIRILVLFTSRTIIVWLLVFAAINRWFSSSTNARRRNLNTLKNAQRSILIVLLFSLLLNGPLLYCYEANLIGTPAQCYGYSESCRLYADLSFTCGTLLIPLLFMILFGLLTIHNIRQVQRRVHNRSISMSNLNNVTIKTNANVYQHKKKTDRSLFKMLSVQVLFLILCTTPYIIYRLYVTVIPTISSKSELQNAVDRLRQKLYDVEIHSQDKQNKYIIEKQQWEIQRLELTGKINEVIN